MDEYRYMERLPDPYDFTISYWIKIVGTTP